MGGVGEPPRPGSGRVCNQMVESREGCHVSRKLLSHWAGFPCTFVKLDSSVLTFVFPFGLFFSLQISVVNSSLGKHCCILGMEHQRHMGPVKDIQCPVLTEARLEVL